MPPVVSRFSEATVCINLLSETTSDPLDRQSGAYELPVSENAIIDAFELAASSFAVNLGLPNATFYRPASASPPPELRPPPEPVPSDLPASASRPRELRPPLEPVAPDLPASGPAPPTPPTQPRMPNPALIYPPPIPDESDPDGLRLLHSWYWAGYYTGLADGKRVTKQ
jgi:hypothetical protein